MCRSQWTVPWDSTALDAPVRSGTTSPRCFEGFSGAGRRACEAEPSDNVEFDGLGVEAGQQPELTGRFEDHAFAVGGGVADVEVLVVRVAAQVAAVGQDGIEVSVALVVGQERDPSLDPQGVGEVSVQRSSEPDEFTVSVGVDPQLAGGAAAVALPPGRLTREDAGEHHGAFVADDGAIGHGLDRAEREFLRPAAGHGEAVGVGVTAVGLAERAGDQDVAVGGEALDPGGRVAEVAQLAVAAAVDVGRDDFRGSPLDDGPDQTLAVGGEAGVAGRQLQGGYAPGAAPAHGCNPDVVLGHKGDQIAVQMRETEVTRGGHRSIIATTVLTAREVSRPCRAW